MKRIIPCVVAILLSQSVFAKAVYETDTNGVASFSNNKTKVAEVVNLKSDPITVLPSSTNLESESAYLSKFASHYRHSYHPYNYSDTLQGSFPEQLTDNYFDFYGRNHHYESLMSSTHNGGFYDSSGANNSRLRNNY